MKQWVIYTMTLEFWLGLLLAIPIGILTNIYTPKLEEFLSKRNNKIATRRKIRLAKEQKEIEYYSENRSEFLEYLIVTSLKAAFFGAIAGLVSGLLFTLASSSNLFYIFDLSFLSIDEMQVTIVFSTLLSIISQLVGLIGTLIVITIYRAAFNKFEKVKNLSVQKLDQ